MILVLTLHLVVALFIRQCELNKAIIKRVPTFRERYSRTSLPYIVNVDFSCSSQHFVFREPSRGHGLPLNAWNLAYI